MMDESAASPQELQSRRSAGADICVRVYAALCFRHKDNGTSIEILVVTSRDSGRWSIPKGWPMERKAISA
jgi:8-oxo-dGTP pyrophosphatase MutT (NUDIX family)